MGYTQQGPPLNFGAVGSREVEIQRATFNHCLLSQSMALTSTDYYNKQKLWKDNQWKKY